MLINACSERSVCDTLHQPEPIHIFLSYFSDIDQDEMYRFIKNPFLIVCSLRPVFFFLAPNNLTTFRKVCFSA